MTSQITKDFQMKSKLRKYADGGNVRPALLGDGMAGRAGGLLSGRGRQIDDAVNGAVNPKPTQTSAPAEAPKPEKKGLRSFFGLADGGVSAEGGRVKGPGGRTDDKVGPVMLSDEEYVLPGDTADAIGRDKLDAIRLATHDFKDGRKESALRGRADGGDGWYDDMMPMDHLADGGNPWIADASGNVRKPNAFGDAAAGPGYQQPRLPPPQPGTAVGPSAISPGAAGPRTINMGMVEEVPRQRLRGPSAPPRPTPAAMGPVSNPNVGPNGSKEAQNFRDMIAARDPGPIKPAAGGALRAAGSALAKGGAVVGSGLAAKDIYDNGLGWGNGGDLVTSGAALAGPVGVAGAAGWGIGRAIGSLLPESVTDAIGGTVNQIGQNTGLWGVDDSALLQSKAEERLRASKQATQPSPVAAATSALRSDQGPAQPVTPDSYQSRRLSEMGVPLDVQNSKPVVDSVTGNTRDFLRTGGTSQYQNLGTYGGNGNIYGKADDPSRPGRINNFVGVGADASPANGASGSGSNAFASAIKDVQSSLRGYGGEPAQPMANSRSSAVDAINARYDRLLKEGRGKAVEFGSDWSQRHGIALEKARGDELSSVLNNENTNATSRANAQLDAETSRSNAELSARTSLIDTLGRMEQNRATLSSQAQAAQLKALQDALAQSEKRMEDNAKVFESVADTFAAGDKDKQSQYRELLSTLPPELHAEAQGLAPEDKRAFYTNIMRQQLGRNEGLVIGRDAGATIQNAAIGGLIGRMTRFGNGAGGKAVDSALGKIPRVGPALSALRPAENLARFGTLIGAAGGAYATPEVENLTRWDPHARDPETGAALPARKDIREAFTYGAFDTYLNPFDDSVQTVSGRRTNKPTPDEEEAARRFRSALRN